MLGQIVHCYSRIDRSRGRRCLPPQAQKPTNDSSRPHECIAETKTTLYPCRRSPFEDGLHPKEGPKRCKSGQISRGFIGVQSTYSYGLTLLVVRLKASRRATADIKLSGLVIDSGKHIEGRIANQWDRDQQGTVPAGKRWLLTVGRRDALNGNPSQISFRNCG